MNPRFQQWFEDNAGGEGVLACGLRHPDRTTLCRTMAVGFSDEAVENAMRCVADLFDVLQHSRLDYGRVSWLFQQSALHCERRPDGVCLAVFTAAGGNDGAVLDRLFDAFRNLPASAG